MDLVEVRAVRRHTVFLPVEVLHFETALVRFLLVRLVEVGRAQGTRDVRVAHHAADPAVADDEDRAHGLAANHPPGVGSMPLGQLFYDHRIRVVEDASGFQTNVRATHPLAE